MQPAGQVSPDGRWIWNGAQWVPNQPPPYQPPQAMHPYESARQRGVLAMWFLGGVIVGLLLLILFDVVDAVYSSQTRYPGDALTLAVGLISIVAVVVFYGFFISSIVFFCMWLHRVVRNMPSLGSPDPRWSPARAVVYCFVPILNLFHPFWSVLDAWRGADPSRRWTDRSTLRAIRPSALLAGWWALWLIGGILSRISFYMSSSAGGSLVDVVANVAIIGAAVLAILVVRDVTARQEYKQGLISTGQLV